MALIEKQPPTTDNVFVSITCVLQSSIGIVNYGLLKLELPTNMPMIISPEKPHGSSLPFQSNDFDGKHEIYHFVAKMLEKICEQLPKYYYKLTGDSEE
jgi:hypothetical protein